MNKIQINKLMIAALGLIVMASASAKLPALTDEAKANADETKNKADWSTKVAAYQLCQAQDKVAAAYLQQNAKPKPSVAFPPCANPGPYIALQISTSTVGVADSKPVPAAGKKE